ncbi:MAG: PD-(D/E)XK nuclease family protein [Deltaproteobacteria bacterium]|nr:PD-(D/E)XK nuclease family protein [Deltaproteobacteria bacterium]
MGVLQNQFSWSKSRDEKFRECPRQYYYHHYGSWGGWDQRSDPKIRELYILKNLKSRQMWMGEVVHHAVENALKHYQQNQEMPTDAFLTQLTQRMRREFKESRDKRYRQSPGKLLGLYEHEYEKGIPDEKWVEIHESARRCFSTFANLIFPQRVKPIPVEHWKLIEEMQEFQFEGTKIYVKIDFAYEDENGLKILDWKTGKTEDVDNEIQLDCYGLFSRDHFKIPVERIETVIVNINTGKETSRKMIEAKMDFAKHYLRNSIAGMKRLLKDPEKNIAVEDDFPFTENEKTCRWCNFQKICPKWA